MIKGHDVFAQERLCSRKEILKFFIAFTSEVDFLEMNPVICEEIKNIRKRATL